MALLKRLPTRVARAGARVGKDGSALAIERDGVD